MMMSNRLTMHKLDTGLQARIECLRVLAPDNWRVCLDNPPQTQAALAAMGDTQVELHGYTWRAHNSHGRYVLVLC